MSQPTVGCLHTEWDSIWTLDRGADTYTCAQKSTGQSGTGIGDRNRKLYFKRMINLNFSIYYVGYQALAVSICILGAMSYMQVWQYDQFKR